MWEIYENSELEKEIRRVPREILKRYEKWKDVVRFSGLPGLKSIKGFHDEKLKGHRAGLRSSRLEDQWRVIYRMRSEVSQVLVLKLTPHDYRNRA